MNTNRVAFSQSMQPGAIRQPSNQATKQPSNQATQQPSNQATKQPSSQPANQPSSQAAKQPSNCEPLHCALSTAQACSSVPNLTAKEANQNKRSIKTKDPSKQEQDAHVSTYTRAVCVFFFFTAPGKETSTATRTTGRNSHGRDCNRSDDSAMRVCACCVFEPIGGELTAPPMAATTSNTLTLPWPRLRFCTPVALGACVKHVQVTMMSPCGETYICIFLYFQRAEEQLRIYKYTFIHLHYRAWFTSIRMPQPSIDASPTFSQAVSRISFAVVIESIPIISFEPPITRTCRFNGMRDLTAYTKQTPQQKEDTQRVRHETAN